MPTRGDTTPVQSIMDLLRGEVAKHHDRINKHGTQLVVLVGDDGKGGKVAEIARDIDETRKDIREHATRIRIAENAIGKGMILSAMIAVIGSAVVSALLAKVL